MEEFILLEAEKLFMKYGMRSVTMDDIAKQLGMSKKTIYTHFKDKNELVIKLIAKMLHDDECQMDACSLKAENAIHEVFLMIECLKEMLSGINPVVFYDLEKYHNEAYCLMMNFHHTHIYNKVKAGLERGIGEKIFREDINQDILASVRVNQINWSFQCDLVRSGKHSLYEVMEETAIHFLHGVSTLTGFVLINNYKNKKHNEKSY